VRDRAREGAPNAAAHVLQSCAQRLRILLRRPRAAERIDRQQHVANLRDTRQQLIRDEQ
jgi:hypothetical protein